MTDQAEVGWQLERFRDYLALLARLQIAAALRGKVDLSGVVQQTLMEAFTAWDRFDAMEEGSQAAWLRRALAFNLQDEARRLTAAARDVRRDRTLEVAVDDSAARVEAWLAAQQSSPSERVTSNEELLRLAGALAHLPADQRTAVELHHLEGRSVLEVAEEMGRTHTAVGGLLARGRRKLRELLGEKPGGQP